MNILRLLIQFWISLSIVGMALYFYVDQKNELIRLQMEIPVIEKELKGALEENTRLRYRIQQFQDPEKLLELHRQPSYATMKYSSVDQVLILSGGQIETTEE